MSGRVGTGLAMLGLRRVGLHGSSAHPAARLALAALPVSLRALLLPLLLLLAACPGTLAAQAKYAATGPGTYVSVGVAASGFESDYGKRLLGGNTVFLDAHLYRRLGVEAEVRSLRFHSDTGQRQDTYLIGPRLNSHGRNWRPYAKLLAGRGSFRFPYNAAQGSYFVVAPGAGVDYRLPGTRLIVRLADFEYQMWPGFTFGPLHPFGASAGVAFTVF